MSEPDGLQAFLDKWRAHWPEWALAEGFLPAGQRERARAWLALRGELLEAAWGGTDPTPGAAKLGWWIEELNGWARGARRHPLGQALQKLPVDWARLAAALPTLQAHRQPEGDRASVLAGLLPLAQAQAALSAQLFEAATPATPAATAEALLQEWVLHLPERGVPAAGTETAQLLALPALAGGSRVERIQAALVRARLQRAGTGRAGPVPPLRALLIAWRAARRG